MLRNIIFGFIAIVVFVAVFNTTQTMERSKQSNATEPAPPAVMTRDEFIAKCRVGDGYVQCQNAVGRPDRTQGGTSSTEYWYFDRRTRDPVTGKTDHNAQVVIERGWVRAINFY